jgi:hypothetical protein
MDTSFKYIFGVVSRQRYNRDKQVEDCVTSPALVWVLRTWNVIKSRFKLTF